MIEAMPGAEAIEGIIEFVLARGRKHVSTPR